jgi:hypothetical protein
MHHTELAREFALLLRQAAVRRTPGVFASSGKVEDWLLGKIGILVVIYIGRNSRKGEIKGAAFEW